MARSSSPAIGCSTERPLLSRRTHKRAVVEVEIRPAQADGLADAQPVTVHHEHEQMVARAMPAPLGTVAAAGRPRLRSGSPWRGCGASAASRRLRF